MLGFVLTVGLAARVALAAVFFVSGAFKLADRVGTRQAVAGFGVPARLTGAVALALAPVELGIAALLLVPRTAAVGLVLAATVLSGFTLAVVLALRVGRRPECHCFGRIGGADISARTVARNTGLLALAVLGLIAGSGSEDDPGRSAIGAAVVAGLVLAAFAVAAEGLSGRVARRRRAQEDEAAFERVEVARLPAPQFSLPTLSGGETSLRDLLKPGLPVLLVTLSAGCGPCRALRPDMAQWAQILAPQLTVAVLATGTVASNKKAYEDVPDLPVLIDDQDVRHELGTSATPSAVVIAADGVLASPVASGEPLVRRLLASTLLGDEVGDIVDPAVLEEPEGSTPAGDLDLDSVVRPRGTVRVQHVGESTVLLDPTTGGTVVVDRIGALVWSVLDGSSRLGDIVADIADVFGSPASVVGPDVLALVQSIGRAGLLEGVVPDTPTPHQHATVG